MHSPLTENADGDTAVDRLPGQSAGASRPGGGASRLGGGLVVDQHAIDDLDRIIVCLGVSTVNLFKQGYPVGTCEEMLRATRHAKRAAMEVTEIHRLSGRPEARDAGAFRWTRQLNAVCWPKQRNATCVAVM